MNTNRSIASIPRRDLKKPHAVCVPYPAQGHINPMLKLARRLHHQGFHITFVHTEFNYHRLIRCRTSADSSLRDMPDFRFESIPDGLQLSAPRATPQELVTLAESMDKNCPVALRALISRLCHGADPEVPPVSCIVSDAVMSFTLYVAEELGVPDVFLWTSSACSFLACLQFPQLIDWGIIPLKDESYLTNGYFDTIIDRMIGMQNIRLKDLPTFIRTTSRNDIMLMFCLRETGRAGKASGIILNTFESLEKNVLDGLSVMLPHNRMYPIGPLNLLYSQLQPGNDDTREVNHNFWGEDMECLQWLDSKEHKSVIYVNFGSIATVTLEQLAEFAWGLANSNQNFLWVIRPDLVANESAILPVEFGAETKDRGLVTNWVSQEEVLGHPSIGGFLTHCGWNSTLESMCNGVPMLCWPFGADQPTNCRYCCTEWGIGMGIDGNVKRQEVEMMVRELMTGEKGGAMQEKAAEWKRLAREAVDPGGSSWVTFDMMVREVLLLSESSKVSRTSREDSV